MSGWVSYLGEPTEGVPEDDNWPEAWYMLGDVEAGEPQKAENRLTPDQPATVEELKALGIKYWKVPSEEWTYPKMSVPWNPSDALDPKLAQIRTERGYNYADIITITPEALPGFDDKVKAFFTEHIHADEEIRYIIDGSGYFDVRNFDDEWIRIWIKGGDLMTLPEGIYHRFSCDTDNFIHAMRLFKGVPIWTPLNRPAEEHASRKYYLNTVVMCGGRFHQLGGASPRQASE